MATQFNSWWQRRYHTPIQELYRAANANLSTLAQQRRDREAASAYNKQARAMRAAERQAAAEDRRELRAELKALRAQLRGLEPEWGRLLALHTAGTISAGDHAALEEYDAMRESVVERINAKGDALAEALRELRGRSW